MASALRSSHGCIRLYPEDVEKLFGMIDPGTQVTVVNQPFVFGWHEGQLYLQAYDVLEDDKRDWRKSQPKLLSKTLTRASSRTLADNQGTVDWERVAEIASDPRGLALSVSVPTRTDRSAASRPRCVCENRVPEGANWDGADDPALQAQSDVEAWSPSSSRCHALELVLRRMATLVRMAEDHARARSRASRMNRRAPPPSSNSARPSKKPIRPVRSAAR